jgi:hypothetical protein
VSQSPHEKFNLRADRREAPCPKHGASSRSRQNIALWFTRDVI